jgi:uncharacterized protein
MAGIVMKAGYSWPRVIRESLLFIVVVAAALIAGALLAWPLQLLFPDIAFSRLAGRSSLICALLFSLIYLRLTLPLSAATLGFARPAAGALLKCLGQAYIAGILIMLALSLMLWLSGIREIDTSRSFALNALGLLLLKAAVGGVVVGIIEEFIFRGALFSSLQQRINALWAIVLTSLLYSAVHFIKYPPLADGQIVRWDTGLALLPEALSRLTQPAIIDEFLTYLLLGVLLGLIRLRDGHIYRCIALHAGIVLVLQIDRYVMTHVPDNRFDFLTGDYNNRLGWLAAAWLLILIMIYWRKRTP